MKFPAAIPILMPRFTAFLVLLTFGDLALHAQTTWTKDADNPILTRDTIIENFPNDLIAISDPCVIKEGGVYKMWYTAGGMNYPIDTALRSRICYATSTDGLNWEKYGYNPVLDVSYDGSWDSLGVETATVVWDSTAVENERYKMWYAGQYYNSYRYDIGYATSADGMNWTKHPTPVLQVGTPSEWDNGFIEGPSVILENGHYRMWYCGYDAVVDGSETTGKANIGYATSADGIVWAKHPENPIFTTDVDAWDSRYVQDPQVTHTVGNYEMWYGGNDVEGYGQQVGYATSSDGISWFKYDQNPALTKGNAGDWDAGTASFPAVIKTNDKYEMWYTGKDVNEPIPNDLNYYWELGYASSPIGPANVNNAPHGIMITVSPNPVKGILRIEYSDILENASLVIHNSSGQKITKKTIVSDNSPK